MTTRSALSFTIAALLLTLSAGLMGCHADANDPVGQAEELADPVRRQNAIHNLSRIYSEALAAAEGDRSNEAVVAVTNQIVEPLTNTYVEHDEDRSNGQAILDLLKEMQDPRALPAIKASLRWRTGVTEQHALRGAQALLVMEVPDAEKAEVVQALATAFQQISGVRDVDNQMRVTFVRAIGAMHHESAVQPLVDIMQAQSENQHFLINRLAARKLGELGSPEAVEPMIAAFFQFSPNNPALRMADVASEALVRIGRPSLQPLLQMLAGNHQGANQGAAALVAAIRQRNPAMAQGLEPAKLVRSEAINAIGMLGMADAFDPLMAETQQEDLDRRLDAAVGLIRLTLSDAQRQQVSQRLITIYNAIPEREWQKRGVLLATMQNAYDPALLPLMMTTARNRDLYPPLRETAMSAYAHMSNAAQSRELQQLIGREPSEVQNRINQFLAGYLEVGIECDTNLQCYIGKLGDADGKKVEKAAYMIGLLAQPGDEAAITALVAHLDHAEIGVRNAVLVSLDHIAVNGSQAVVDKIDEMAETGGGQAVWRQFRGIALPTQARIRARAAN